MKTIFDTTPQVLSSNVKKPIAVVLFILVWILIDKGNAAGQSAIFSKELKTSVSSSLINGQPQFKLNNRDGETQDDGNEEVDFTVYPNPVIDELIFDFEFQVKTEMPFEVTDALGRLMDRGIFKPGLSAQRLDFSKYRSGLYMVRVSLGNTTVVKRVIKK